MCGTKDNSWHRYEPRSDNRSRRSSQLSKTRQTWFRAHWNRQANWRHSKVTLLIDPFGRERQVGIGGEEIVRFVVSCWKRNFLRRRFRAAAASSSGKASS